MCMHVTLYIYIIRAAEVASSSRRVVIYLHGLLLLTLATASHTAYIQVATYTKQRQAGGAAIYTSSYHIHASSSKSSSHSLLIIILHVNNLLSIMY
jgi:hypothetical protein